MNIIELLIVLYKHPDTALEIMLPNGEFVPSHFHVTEVGHVKKKFIDCGGMYRETHDCVLQVWLAKDYDHRLKSDKLAKILSLSQTALGQDDLPIVIEYESGVISQYPLADVEVTPSGLLFVTGLKHTDCLAKDKCGVAGCC